MATPKPTKAVAEVTPEVTEASDIIVPAKPLGVAPRPLFETTVEDAPPTTSVPQVKYLNPKTIAEQAAGKAAISQYVQQPE